MDVFDDLARQLGIDLDSSDERLGRALAFADDDFLETLVRLRREKGLTQQLVADRMCRDKSAVSRFENLGSDPKLSTIRRYARAVGLMVRHEVEDSELDASAVVEKAELKTKYFNGAASSSVAAPARDDVQYANYRSLGMVGS